MELISETVTLKTEGRGLKGLCPFHDDHNPSLSVDMVKARFKCFACDAQGDAFTWVELTDRLDFASALKQLASRAGVDLPKPTTSSRKKIDKTYNYTDGLGEFLFQVVRYEPKDFRQRRRDAQGRWIWNRDRVTSVLFRLPEVIKAVQNGEGVWITEGEKDALALVDAGVCATTAAGGAKAPWLPEFTQTLQGAKNITIVADSDEPGYRRAKVVRDALDAAGVSVRVVRAKEGKDASDHLAAGHEIDGFVYLSFSQLNTLVASKTGDVTECYPSKGNGVTTIDGSTSNVTPVTDVTLRTYEGNPDPSNILNRIETFLRKYCIFPSESCYTAVSLWAVHTWIFEKFDTTPRLVLPSVEKGSGKTRVLECLENVCHNPLPTINISPAALFRLIESRGPTIIMDEVDAIFVGKNPGESQEALRSILNAGYKQGEKVQRCVNFGEDVAEFAVFAPAALAGIGNLPDTIMARAVLIRMKKRAPDENVESYRLRVAKSETQQIRLDLDQWAHNIEALNPYITEIPLPDGIKDRAAEVWEPLIWIANLAGDEWLTKAQNAAVELTNAAKANRDEGLGHQLLIDIKQAFRDAGVDRMATRKLLTCLYAIEESPWADYEYGRSLNPRQLAQLLKLYGISSQTVRVGDKTAKGYAIEMFSDAWKRYLPSPVAPGVTSVTEVTDVTPHVDGIKECDPVTHKKVTSLFEILEDFEQG